MHAAVTVSLDGDRVLIYLGTYRKYIVVEPGSDAVPATEWGRHWFWHYAGRAECSHPSDDYEGAADAIEKFLRDIPGTRRYPPALPDESPRQFRDHGNPRPLGGSGTRLVPADSTGRGRAG